MKPTQKVTNIIGQLTKHCDQGANNLGQVINTSKNARFTLSSNICLWRYY